MIWFLGSFATLPSRSPLPIAANATPARIRASRRFPAPRFLVSLAIGFKNFRDFFDRVPIAGRRCDAQGFLDLAEVADRLHLPPIQTQNEPVMDRAYHNTAVTFACCHAAEKSD